jgi:hypothetical protein
LGDTIQHDEKIITIDDMLVAHAFIANIDEAMNHYETRGEYTKRIGQALAQAYDRNLLSLGVRACRNTGSGQPGEGPVGQQNAVSSSIGAAPTIQEVVDGFYAAAQQFDENNLPEEGRYAVVPPSVYWDLVTNDKLLDKDFSMNGDYSAGIVRKVAGFGIYKSNNLALDHTSTANEAIAPESAYNTYQVDASDTKALCFTQEAMGTVKLMDVASEMEYMISRQGTLMVSKMAVGHGTLRPEALYEIRAA